MKKLVLLIAAIGFITVVFSQSPNKMSYQAVIRDNSKNLVTGEVVGMKISILQGSAEGNAVYTETQSEQTNANGLFSIEIGTGTATGDFSSIDWSNGPYFIKTETDPNGGSNYTIVGTSQLLSVPYALYSTRAGNVFSGNYNDLTNLPVLFDGIWGSLTGKPVFATVATSGSYNDLTDKPTTLVGYGITDGMNTSHAANGITSGMITDWNTAFSWGDHTGLYRPIGYVPTWSEVTEKPDFAAVATSGSYTDLINIPSFEGSPWTSSGDDIYYNDGNVGVGTSSPETFLHAHGSPVESRGQLSLSSPSGEGVFLSMYDADEFKAYLWYNVDDEDLRLQNYASGDLNLNPYAGDVGIGTNSPEFRLTIDNDGGILAKGTFNVGRALTESGQGTRLIWYPRKSAFRAGGVDGGEWDDANIGIYSTAMGRNTTASGIYSTALGRDITTSGAYSTAMGIYNVASGHSSVAIGASTIASGIQSAAIGGYTTASGHYSSAMGYRTTAEPYVCFVYGRYNVISDSYNSGSWEDTDPLFIIGNGSSASDRHDAVMVKKDGSVVLPDVYDDPVFSFLPCRDLYITSLGQIGYLTSSRRYKRNINPMEDVSWLYELRPVNFVYNSDNSDTKQYGLIAEEVENVNPLFVSYNDKGEAETVSYGQLISPVIKALQEQQKLIEELKARIEVLENN